VPVVEEGRTGSALRDRVREVALRRHDQERLEPDPQRVRPIELVTERRERGDLLGIDGDEEVLAGREMAVERRVADAGAACDLVQRRVRAVRGEDNAGGFEQALGVASGIGAFAKRGGPRFTVARRIGDVPVLPDEGAERDYGCWRSAPPDR
jgi:hypothetical protein